MSNIIDKIQVSGVTYDLVGSGGGVPESVFTAYTASTDSRIGEDEEVTAAALNALDEKIDSISGGGNPTVEVTQAEYDAMVTAGTVSADTYYIITDAQGGDLSNYYTKTETNTLLNGKQATLVSGTNIKTINNQSILGSGNIDIQGGGVDVVQTTGTSTTDVMSQDAVTTQLNNKASKSQAFGSYQFGESGGMPNLKFKSVSSQNLGNEIYYPKINGKGTLTNNGTWAGNNLNFSLVETSAITTSISSSSTDAQVPSAKAVYDQLGGLKLVKLTQSAYDGLATKDNSTLYVIVNPSWHIIPSGSTISTLKGSKIRVSSSVLANEGDNVAFGTTSNNVYSLVYAPTMGGWLNWQTWTSGISSGDIYAITPVDGYYEIDFGEELNGFGSYTDSSATTTTDVAPFEFEIYY